MIEVVLSQLTVIYFLHHLLRRLLMILHFKSYTIVIDCKRKNIHLRSPFPVFVHPGDVPHAMQLIELQKTCLKTNI